MTTWPSVVQLTYGLFLGGVLLCTSIVNHNDVKEVITHVDVMHKL